jgi:hypothetical protein
MTPRVALKVTWITGKVPNNVPEITPLGKKKKWVGGKTRSYRHTLFQSSFGLFKVSQPFSRPKAQVERVYPNI